MPNLMMLTPTPEPQQFVFITQTRIKRGLFTKEDVDLSMTNEPNHQDLCDNEQAFVLAAIRNDVDLTRHMDDAVQSLNICLAADKSIKTRPRHHPLE